MNRENAIQINLDKLLRQRIPQHYRWVPHFLVKWLERVIHQEELNVLLRNMARQPGGVEAADSALRDLGITTTLLGEENIPPEGRFIFASNHPLGGLDGLSLISCLGHKYGGNIRFLANDLLMAVKPLAPIFLPVNKFGRQSRLHAAEIEAQYMGDNQMIAFPAGLCSRMSKNGDIRDLPWHKFIITRAVQTRRDIVPIFFEGQNTMRFYRVAKWRKRLGIKFNLEQALLPGEMLKSRGSTFYVRVGKPIAWTTLDATHAHAEVQRMRDRVYALAPRER